MGDECPFNSLQVQGFGDSFSQQAKTTTVVNSGVIIGSLGPVLRLLEAMREVVLHFPNQQLNDQAILNFLLRAPLARPLLPSGAVEVVPHGQGLVRNVGPELFMLWRSY